MIFVHITDVHPSNSGAEQDYESESAFVNNKKKKPSLYSLFTEELYPFTLASFRTQPTNKQVSIDSPSSQVLSPEPSPNAWERYVTNQGSSLPVGSSQYCSRKQPVHSDKLASICAAHNLSCSGTRPSGLAGITATTHPQPLLESQVNELSGCGWAGTGEGRG